VAVLVRMIMGMVVAVAVLVRMIVNIGVLDVVEEAARRHCVQPIGQIEV
jgi:hypothetical protein